MEDRVKQLALNSVPESARPKLRQAYGTVRRAVGSVAYRGNDVECLCCDWQGRSFLPVHGRPNAICPRCGSGERHRFLWKYLDENPERVPQGSRILHIAPEPSIGERLQKTGSENYLSADLNRSDVDVRTDVTRMEFDDGSFDCIVCSHVLEHVPDDRKAISEIRRVMSNHGCALIQVPVYDTPDGKTVEDPLLTTPEQRHQQYGQFDHLRKYGRDFKTRLEEVGLSVDIVSPRTLPTSEKDRLRVLSLDDANREDIYVCTKQA